VGSSCAALGAAAAKASAPLAAAQVRRRVGGAGRLQFHTAPDAACIMKGVFILPSETVQAYADHAGYTLVKYVNPRNGFEVTGWVQAARLTPY
jgi:hypothetical protein